jgi:hypothetical protein
MPAASHHRRMRALLCKLGFHGRHLGPGGLFSKRCSACTRSVYWGP